MFRKAITTCDLILRSHPNSAFAYKIKCMDRIFISIKIVLTLISQEKKKQFEDCKKSALNCSPNSGQLLIWQEIADMEYQEENTAIPPPPVVNSTPTPVTNTSTQPPVEKPPPQQQTQSKPKPNSSSDDSDEAMNLNQAFIKQQITAKPKNILSELELSQKIQQGVTLVYNII